MITRHIFAGNRRIASRTGAQVSYYHPDHLGGLHVATNSGGARVETALYYPFGETRHNGGSTDLAYKFTGQELDDTGLYYYGARYYDPVAARFISPDSIVQAPLDPQSLNRYSYCRNNPVMYTDPTGHIWWFFGMLAAGAAFGATMAAINGQDPGMGALTGAITALGFMGAHFATAGMAEASQAAMVHAGVGAATGAINAAITGADPGFAALTGGISGGISRYVGGYLPKGFAQQLGGRMLTGAVSGGLTAAIVGGDFSQGAFNGAWTAGFAYLFNCGQEVTAGWLKDRAMDAWNGIKQGVYGGTLGIAGIAQDGPAEAKALLVMAGVTTVGPLVASGGIVAAPAGAAAVDALTVSPLYGTLMSAAGTGIGQLFLNGLPDYVSAALPAGTAPMPNIPGFVGFMTGYYLQRQMGQ